MTKTKKSLMICCTIAILTVSSGIILLTQTTQALAYSDFEINIQRTYTVATDKQTLHITEKRVVKTNSSTYYIPSTAKETFTIQNFKQGLDQEESDLKRNSITVTNDSGYPMGYNTEISGDDIIVTADYTGSITHGQSKVFQLEYDTNELIETVGKLTNIYIPGLEESYEETTQNSSSSTTTTVTYKTFLEIPTELGQSSFTYPQPSQQTTAGNTTTYEFNTPDIIGKTVWHQIGTDQIYNFKITQPTTKTDFTTPSQVDFISKNKYTIILPREYDESNQKVFFSNITPEPDEISRDDDGNVFAVFYTNATQNSEITVEGYITTHINLSNPKEVPTNPTLDQLSNLNDMSQYLSNSEYWEVDTTEIQAKAAELAQGKTSILEIIHADYEFIVDAIDYDDFKYGEENERLGALAALEGGSSVCMEYSDLLIALTRAQGIPSRAAYGYGYDPKHLADEQETHQWVQVWLPDYGWLSIDPTWGETGREFIGRDLDHALWYVASTHPNEPSPLEVVSSTLDFDLEPSTIEITAVDEIPDEKELSSVEDLMQDIGEETSEFAKLSRSIQVSILGRILVIISPIAGFVFTIMFLGRFLTQTIMRQRSKITQSKPKN
ncbi:MAG: transglutaminase-like domain-containing protein [Patescibacteria group bacterium]|nr:transglutaminase-like domain-containing protein [Patescibacteria group bacterium]